MYLNLKDTMNETITAEVLPYEERGYVLFCQTYDPELKTCTIYSDSKGVATLRLLAERPEEGDYVMILDKQTHQNIGYVKTLEPITIPLTWPVVVAILVGALLFLSLMFTSRSESVPILYPAPIMIDNLTQRHS